MTTWLLWPLWLSFHLTSYLLSSFSFLFSNQTLVCISHRPKSNNLLTFLTTLNEAPSHTILLSLPPSLHPNTLFTTALKPTLQKPPSGTQTYQTFYTASLFVKAGYFALRKSVPVLPFSLVCLYFHLWYTAVSARIALRSLWAATSTDLLTAHGFLNPTKHPSFRKANRHDQLQCANRKLRLRLFIMYVSSMNRTRNDINSR